MTARAELENLQFNQLDHDQKFHPDILCLPTQRRINHMVLHFAKYSGKFAIAKQNQDRDLLIDTIVDTFIISIATANIFGLRISDIPDIEKHSSDVSIAELAKHLVTTSNASEDNIFSYVCEGVAIEAGKMSKAIESLDHLEEYPYKETLVASLQELFKIVFVSAFYIGINLIDKVHFRLVDVERKSMFYKKHRSSKFEKFLEK